MVYQDVADSTRPRLHLALTQCIPLVGLVAGALLGLFASSARADLFVSSHLGDRGKRYNETTGAYIEDFVSVDGPVGVLFGPDGKLYVADVGNDSVLRYDLSTGLVDTFASACGDRPHYLVFTNTDPTTLNYIPEPSTLVGLLGMGAMGLLRCGRRRRRHTR